MKKLFRIVLTLSMACLLLQSPLSIWAQDSQRVKTINPVDIGNPATDVKKATITPKSAKPDLVVSNINYSPGTPTVNDEITIWVFVKNIGQAPAGASGVRVKVGGESNPPVIPVPGLIPGQEYRYSRKVTFSRTGNYIVTVTADAESALAESKEDNNVGQKTIQVKPAPKPDLVVTKINYSPGAPAQHQQVTVWYFVKNIGPGTAGACYLWTTNSMNSYSIWHRELVPALDPGREWRYEGLFLSNQAGTYTLRAVIDRGNGIDETNEENNILDRQIIVGPPVN